MTRRSPRRGLLVALEGIDGSGKSSVARKLAARWRRQGYRVTVRREPSDRRLGAAALGLARADPWGAAMLFTLDRLLARPDLERALRTEDVVLQDRSFYSTLAYQGHRLPDRERSRLAGLQRGATVPPDRVVWLDLAPKLALERVGRRKRARSAVERQRFLTGVRHEYGRWRRARGWVVVDAARPLPALVEEIDARLGPILRSGRRRKGTGP